nr:immunoglobulin light chain junction region [Macaca mulatta]MOX55633.1 immunoglobulin light chain junction region [Macaca mulatta]MOX56280.1 immunoglobulin light chain junction region [Macaca mulatta]MOX57764.1 immunoglobulin light chain junction region [Macaca mulatta]
CLQSNYWPFTF